MARGQCLCGTVAWTIEPPFADMVHCHCGMCRKAHGMAYATFVTYPPEALRWERGADAIRAYASSPGTVRNSCARCGSKLPALEPFAVAFPGPMTGDFGVTPSHHICVASKAPWHDILDDLPRHAGLAGAGELMPTPRHTEPAADRVRGSCLCGRVAFELAGPLVGGTIVSCHCSRCRRGRAALHASNYFVDPAVFAWLRGEDELLAFKVPDAAVFAQTFCGHCGSPMPSKGAPRRRAIPCGALDDDPSVREGPHIFVGSKQPWEIIYGDRPQYDTLPPGEFPPVARRPAD